MERVAKDIRGCFREYKSVYKGGLRGCISHLDGVA